jgi:hypothetical protein
MQAHNISATIGFRRLQRKHEEIAASASFSVRFAKAQRNVKKQLAILAVVLVLCSASTAGASSGIGIVITPDSQHSSPGKTVEYTITVHNYDLKSKSVALEVDAGKCDSSWFEWTEKSVYVRARSVNSLTLKVTPSMNATAKTYNWNVATTSASASASATIVVQGYDYASETHVEGKGVFVIDKDVSSFSGFDAEHQFSVSFDKHYAFSGEIDGFVSDEYLIEGAQGDNPNFEQKSAVGDYSTKASGDFLYGSEKLHSPFPFGGTGTTIREQYDVHRMDLRLEDVNLHSTGNQRYKSELATINEFGGHFLLDAKQSVPGYTQVDIRNEFFGNLTVCKHLIFRRPGKTAFAP